MRCVERGEAGIKGGRDGKLERRGRRDWKAVETHAGRSQRKKVKLKKEEEQKGKGRRKDREKVADGGGGENRTGGK